jgi:hypothetical protein
MRRTSGWIVTAVFLAFGMAGAAAAQQNSQGDVPKSQPGPNNPDIQQQKMQKGGRAVPDSNKSTKESGESTKGGKRDKKKPHNPQTHGAQKHNPSNQA